MKTYGTLLPGLKIGMHITYPDNRGSFHEAWKTSTDGMRGTFRQLNQAISTRGVLRGLHRADQSKLVMPITGKIFDVAVNVDTKEWFAVELDKNSALFIPPQYAHGYLVLSDEAIVQYIVDGPYDTSKEESFLWDSFGINWPLTTTPILSKKDAGIELKF